MEKERIFAIMLLAASVALTVISFIFLPETVTTQVGISNVTTMPKFAAIAIPAVLGVGGSIASFFSKSKNKPLTVSVVGVVLFLVMLVVNLAFR